MKLANMIEYYSAILTTFIIILKLGVNMSDITYYYMLYTYIIDVDLFL